MTALNVAAWPALNVAKCGRALRVGPRISLRSIRATANQLDCASTLLRQPESEEHDGKARELRQGRHLAEREEADQKGETRHQRREDRGAAGAEQHDRAGEKIGPSGA